MIKTTNYKEVIMEDTMINLVEKLGVPVGILLVFSYGFWQSVSWFGNRIVVPLQESHIRFLTKSNILSSNTSFAIDSS